MKQIILISLLVICSALSVSGSAASLRCPDYQDAKIALKDKSPYELFVMINGIEWAHTGFGSLSDANNWDRVAVIGSDSYGGGSLICYVQPGYNTGPLIEARVKAPPGSACSYQGQQLASSGVKKGPYVGTSALASSPGIREWVEFPYDPVDELICE